MALYLDLGSKPLVFGNFNQNLDLLENILPYACYDLYDEVNKPSMWIDAVMNTLVISMGERCGFIIFVPLTWTNVTQNPFGTPVIHETFEFSKLDTSYIAATAFMPTSLFTDATNPGKVFYVIQSYNRTNPTLLVSVDVDTMAIDIVNLNIQVNTWSQLHMVWANFTTDKDPILGLYVFATGSYAVSLLSTTEWANGTFGSLVSQACLPMKYSMVSSAFFKDGGINQKYLYFSVNSGNGAIGRISIQNFCLSDCGVNGYCNAGICACQAPYTQVLNTTTNTRYCENPIVINIITREIQDQVAIVFFAIITACLFFVALVGWASWWKIRLN
jgi:hypothetical protein